MSKTNLLKFYDAYNKTFSEIEQKVDFTNAFYETFLSGQTEISQKYLSENKSFDEEWIRTVESYVPSLNKIVANPKSTLKMEEEITIIEKARKINSQSIKHLSANTHLIKEVDEQGMVIPKKILTTFPEIEYGTYENRFIMTLIDRLFIFVRNRYDVIKRNIDQLEIRELTLNSTFPVNETTVELNLKLTFKDIIQNKQVLEYNKKLLERIEYLNKVVTSLKASSFMEKMTNQRKIYPPIMRTNIITKDVDYRNSYLLWLFLDRYNTLAFKVTVKEKDLSFTDNYFQALHRQVLTLYSTIVANQEMNKKTYEEIEPKVHEKNSLKVIRRRPDEFLLDPEDEIIEDQTLNEYYLNQNKKIFEQSIEYHLNEVKTYETALKRALRETLNISNALYESFFELEENDNIFTQLITEVDVTKELTEARRKALISKMIREVKAVDYNDALRRERTFLNEIIKYDGLLLKEYQARLDLSQEDLRDMKRLEAERKQAKLKLEQVREELTRVRDSQEEINRFRIEANRRINEYQRELNEKLQAELKKLEKELNKKYDDQFQQLIKAHEQRVIEINQELKREISLIEEEAREKERQIAYEYEQELLKQQALIELQNQRKLAEEQARLKAIEEELLRQQQAELAKAREESIDHLSRNQQMLLLLRRSNQIVSDEEDLQTIQKVKEINRKYE